MKGEIIKAEISAFSGKVIVTYKVAITKENIKDALWYWGCRCHDFCMGSPHTAYIEDGKVYVARIGTTAFGETGTLHDAEQKEFYLSYETKEFSDFDDESQKIIKKLLNNENNQH